MRRLEIGPGKNRLAGFETLNIAPGPHIDHVADCRALPFTDGTFELIYASHVIEHIPWWQTDELLAEWVRVLAPGGALEVWTVDGYKVAKALVEFEHHERDLASGVLPGPVFNPVDYDGWRRFNPEADGYRWVAGRTFAYTKRDRMDDPNWHRAVFTPVSLVQAFTRAGLIDVEQMGDSEVRGKSHGYINLGVRGVRSTT